MKLTSSAGFVWCAPGQAWSQKRVREAGGSRVRLAAGTLYPILYRLEKAGAVSTRMAHREAVGYAILPFLDRMRV